MGVVVATAAAAVVTARGEHAASLPSTIDRSLERPGHSKDLLCTLAAEHAKAPPRREAKMALACPDAPEDSSARVVPIGDDRRRGLVMRSNDVVETTIEPGRASVLRFWAATRGLGDELDVRITFGDAPPWERHLATHERWVHGEIPVPERTSENSPLSLRIETSSKRPRDRDARFILAAPRLIEFPEESQGGSPNIVLYMIDTLRADHTPMYGYARNTMPRTAELAQKAVVFDRAYSTAARTRPATASALTGLYPSRHHARLGRGIDFSEETLAETLRANGWSTWAYVANGNVFAPGFAFEQGFDHFQTVRGVRRDNHAYTEEINEVMLPMLRTYADEPFFLYAHAIDPHSPYDPPSNHAGRFQDPAYDGPITPAQTHSRVLDQLELNEADVAQVRALYDEDILYQDAMFGELLDTLEAAGVLDRTLIVVVADHGDEFHEHGGWEHGNRLFEEQIRIPFLVRLPDSSAPEAKRFASPVSLADVPPTILGLYDIEPPPAIQGRDLSAAILGGNAPTATSLYAEEATNIPGGDLRTLIDGTWKLIRRATTEVDDDATTYELFDLESDPGETIDVGPQHAERLEEMRAEMHRRSRALASPIEAKTALPVLDERTKRQLRALGYLTE